MDDKHILAMNEISGLNEKGGKGTTKVQGGKTYTNVVTRVEVFRKHYGMEYGIETAPLFPATGGIFMQAWIKKDGQVYGTGHAYAKAVSAEKGIEKLETTAIGRALASIGLAGGEYASDTEIESWKERYEEKPAPIHIDLGADDVTPAQWLDNKLKIMEDYALNKPKATLVGFTKGCIKMGEDPIYSKLTQEQIEHCENVLNKLEAKLKERLNGA